MPTIDVAGATVAYTDTGGPGPAILCVPADTRYHTLGRVIGVDGDMDTVAAFIGAADLAPCHVVGRGDGALVALRLVARRPELVRSAVVIDPPETEGLLRELVGVSVPMLVLSKDTFAQRVADTAVNASHVRIPGDNDIAEHLAAT